MPITPSVGRKVWFFKGSHQTEPHDATIIKVHALPEHANPDTPVNLLVVDPDTGTTRCETSIQAAPSGTAWMHYEWMPYQQKVAAAAA